MNFLKEIKSLIFAAAAVGIWSILYPELVYHPDVLKVVEESAGNSEESSAETEQERKSLDQGKLPEGGKPGNSESLYEQLFEADRENIRLKSRLWEAWTRWREQKQLF